jgi:transposase
LTAFAEELQRLADWLAEPRVPHLVMEASGQYWKPVWDVLGERGLELILVNARQVKMVPGQDGTRGSIYLRAKRQRGEAAW